MQVTNKKIIEKVKARLPVVAIIGRPNVGKSTLFNCLMGRRKAVVLDIPGVTRDRNYGQINWEDREFFLIDTGGFEPQADEELVMLVREQAMLAIDEADVLIFLTDVEYPLHPSDEIIMEQLRRTRKPVFLAVNKVDNEQREQAAFEFLRLGVPRVYPISALHKRKLDELMADVVSALPETQAELETQASIRVAIIGKPNVGKSTLLNAILGEKRVIVSEEPGTTRDSVDTLIKRGDKLYTLIDTAGIRRRGKIEHKLERLSTAVAIMSLQRCDIALVVCDATEGITRQDQHIAGYALEAMRGLILVVNKWDLINKSPANVNLWYKRVEYAFKFVSFAPVIYISALKGTRVHKIFDLIDLVYGEYTKRITTGELNAALQEIIQHQRPASYQGREIKIKYATQIATSPPTFAIFTNYPAGIQKTYERYLENQLRQRFGFAGTPLRFFWRKSPTKRSD